MYAQKACIALLIVAFAFSWWPSSASAAHYVNVDRTQADPGQTVTATFSRADHNRAWVGFYEASSPDRNYIEYEYVRDLPDRTYTVTLPQEPGQYQFRYFGDGTYGQLLASSPIITVGAGAHSVSVDQDRVGPGDTINATFTRPAHNSAWIGFYRLPEDQDQVTQFSNYLAYQYLRDLPGDTYSVTAPDEVGKYVFILFGDGGSSNPVAVSPAVTVRSSLLPPPMVDLGHEIFRHGVQLRWPVQSGIVGYRMFRSESPEELGISVTDFFLTSAVFADVNVKPNTTYYYTVKPVLREANPQMGISEELGEAIASATVTTPADVSGSDALRRFIVLQVNNPVMTVEGAEEEIDPGRGTVPMVRAGRTLVPIRAVVQAMGGLVGWNSETQQITLEGQGNRVEMWVGSTEIMVNGQSREMDVAPLVEDGRTFVPLRFAAENLEAEIDWLSSTREIVITF